MLHILYAYKVIMHEEKEWGQGRITWQHDSVLFLHIPQRVCSRTLIEKEHRQVKLGMPKQEVNKTIQFKSKLNVNI